MTKLATDSTESMFSFHGHKGKVKLVHFFHIPNVRKAHAKLVGRVGNLEDVRRIEALHFVHSLFPNYLNVEKVNDI